MNTFAFRLAAIALSLVLSGEAFALGLGELRSTPHLGERPRLEVEIIGAGKDVLDSSCFSLRAPSENDDLPWLKRANFVIRKGLPSILEIRSELPLRDPILQLSVQIACGHEIVRNYIILASPEPNVPSVKDAPLPPTAQQVPSFASDAQPRRERAMPRIKSPRRDEGLLQPLAPRRSEPRRAVAGSMSDRLMLSGGDVGDPSLRLATELQAPASAAVQIGEAQREILRLEFRTLLALNEQATTQLVAAEKLRNLEASLNELQRRASEITQKVEQGVATPALPATPVNEPIGAGGQPLASPAPPAAPTAEVRPKPAKAVVAAPEQSLLSEWGLYGSLLAALLVIGGWLGWRNYRERQARAADDELALIPPAFEVDPQRADEHEELGGVDLHVDPSAMGGPMQVDFPLDSDDSAPPAPAAAKSFAAPGFDSMMSIAAATVDEHFEANPVMELADIMLSFGRVKGAAQALQEYIDHNPQEALQPWIRLMDVYRMAGMREEFDKVARNLNQHFNVEIQQWDPEEPTLNRHTIDMVLDDEVGQPAPPSPLQPKAESMEEMPRIMQQTIDLWRDGDVLAYLQQLLRDNRGGKRAGFSLAVVEEILLLVDLKETLIKNEREAKSS